ncbi:LAME_0A04126g1_1 [Lachancea meyersii CBS 8951]|uniref:LAME_0A04126g1_1 n=1 Tax=Lachancea meyersii CBS 8951 TaxID=1266667 RepID=A0A1G4IPD3_9SACH|nr:LAME_0A04126g1_1 [Lachancea meyersii CBS 8951]
MLARTRFAVVLRRTGQFQRTASRALSGSPCLYNLPTDKNAQQPTSSEGETPKRKPLSRIAIGGTTNHSQRNSGGSIEFATWKMAALLLTLGGTLYYFFAKEKRRLEIEKEAEANRGYGKPLVGGPFKLVDFNGNEFTEENLKGKFSIIYFGFSHCPDICPDELDKLSVWLDKLKQKGIELQPIFITCDPARDPPHVLKEYLSEFHSDLIGLTGDYNAVKHACKQYRVYFSTPPSLKPGQDYLVDHSIFFYLMDPEGQFIDALGRQYDEKTGVEKIQEHVKAFVPKEQREKRKHKWYSFLFN